MHHSSLDVTESYCYTYLSCHCLRMYKCADYRVALALGKAHTLAILCTKFLPKSRTSLVIFSELAFHSRSM